MSSGPTRRWKEAPRAFVSLLDRFPDLDGVLAYNDIMAIGAMRALEDLGRRVPDDVAVVGVDDVAVSALVRPALTTIRLDREQMGARAVDMLMRMRADPNLVTRPRDGRRLARGSRLGLIVGRGGASSGRAQHR